MKKRSYQQYCPLATGLDIIGQRWTFLIVRELLIAPKRYKDLLENLSGIGTNLLADRLKTLMHLKIIEQRKQRGSTVSKVYQLTDLGRELEKPVLALTQWGSQFLEEKQPDALFRPEWVLVAMKAAFNPQKAEYIDICCEWQVDDFIFYTSVHQGLLEIEAGKANNAVARVNIAGKILLAIIFGKKDLKTAINKRDLTFTGSGLAVVRTIEVFRSGTLKKL